MPHQPEDHGSGYPWKAGAPASLTFHETPANVERQLLLEDLPLSTNDWGPRKPRRTPWLLIVLCFLVAGALSLLFHLEQRKGWEASMTSLRGEMETRSRESVLREQSLERLNSDKEKLLLERRSESQSLLGITERTLAELKGSLEEVRALRQGNKELELQIERLREREPRAVGYAGVRLPEWLKAAIDATATAEE
jgi:hypothetical protein